MESKSILTSSFLVGILLLNVTIILSPQECTTNKEQFSFEEEIKIKFNISPIFNYDITFAVFKSDVPVTQSNPRQYKSKRVTEKGSGELVIKAPMEDIDRLNKAIELRADYIMLIEEYKEAKRTTFSY